MATWADLCSFVEAFQTAEGVVKNDALYRTLFNRALGIISVKVGFFDTYWNNLSTDTTHGTLSLSGREVTLPDDCIDIVSAYWGSSQTTWSMLQERESASLLDTYDPAWRSATGTPTKFVRTALGMTLNRQPEGSTDGYLTVYGLGSIPKFSPTAGSTNPLTYLPAPHQELVADYAVANLPMDLREKGREQIAAMQAAREQAKERWGQGVEECVAMMLRRKVAPMMGA